MDGARILLAIEGRESLPVNIHDLMTGYEGVGEERREERRREWIEGEKREEYGTRDCVRTEVIVKAIHCTQCSIDETNCMSGFHTCASSSRPSPSLSPRSFQDKGLSSQYCGKYQRTIPHFLEIKREGEMEGRVRELTPILLHVSIYMYVALQLLTRLIVRTIYSTDKTLFITPKYTNHHMSITKLQIGPKFTVHTWPRLLRGQKRRPLRPCNGLDTRLTLRMRYVYDV